MGGFFTKSVRGRVLKLPLIDVKSSFKRPLTAHLLASIVYGLPHARNTLYFARLAALRPLGHPTVGTPTQAMPRAHAAGSA